MNFTGIGEFMLGAGILINAIMAVITFVIARKAVHKIELLEKNTNSIKDALVLKTDAAARSEGIITGRDQEKAAMAATKP